MSDDDHKPRQDLVEIVAGGGSLGAVVHGDDDEPAIAVPGAGQGHGDPLVAEDLPSALPAEIDPVLPLGHDPSVAQDDVDVETVELATAWFATTQYLAIANVMAGRPRPDDCWEADIDATWWIAFNAHSTPRPASTGEIVPGFGILVKWRGDPIGAIRPNKATWLCRTVDEAIVADAAFIEAVRKATPQ